MKRSNGNKGKNIDPQCVKHIDPQCVKHIDPQCVKHIDKEEDNYLELTIYGIDHTLANSLRRIMISEIETWAIDEIQFIKNSTILPNEYIAHRLGQIPIISEENSSSEKYLELNIKSNNDKIRTWYSESLIPNDLSTKLPIKGIPLVKTIHSQELHLKAYLKRGTGGIHAKWSPVSTCYFKKVEGGIQFIIESIGTIPPIEIYNQSVKILETKLNSFMNDIK
jgi:DNA-directed RNA polymerase subunit D